MPHQRSIPAALERFGVRPSLDPGWQDRGSASFSPRCVVAHHTGFDRDVTGILRNGHGDLPGPLCNVELRRSGHVHVIAAGRANHAGRGGWRGLTGNSSALGIEASSAGRSWTDAQLEMWPRVCAGLLWMIGRDESWLCGHREWTSRKWDPGALDLNWLRRTTGALLRGAPSPTPTPTPVPTIQEDDMPLIDVQPGEKKVYWLEPTAPPGGFLGVKEALVVISTHGKHEVPMDVWFEPVGGPGRFKLVGGRPYVRGLTNSRAGWLYIHNGGTQPVGGSIMYK